MGSPKKVFLSIDSEITVGFSQLIFSTSEDNDLIQICAEFLEDEVGIDMISFLITPGNFGNDSGKENSFLTYTLPY